MSSSADVLAAIRELTNVKQLERSDLVELLRDGIQAALMKKYGPNVRFEITFDELKGTIRIVRLRPPRCSGSPGSSIPGSRTSIGRWR